MRCPHCNTAINISWIPTSAYPLGTIRDGQNKGVALQTALCPECEGLIVKIIYGICCQFPNGEWSIITIKKEEIIYPNSYIRSIEPEVPSRYADEYKEACAVLNISPKASAALSRRILQTILREEFHINKKSLDQEIYDFINLKGIPTHLSIAIDAIRNIGNFAAHPLKDTNTGEIVDVEPGEAEWLLDVLDTLFDFTFVQPKKIEERKKKLNEKLSAIGKPPMKG
jgi:hypothetical protein